MDNDNILSRIVQVGIVTAADAKKRKVRVKFDDTGIISDWLYVVQHIGGGVAVNPDGGHTHDVTVSDTYSGGGSATIAEVPNHEHKGSTTTAWMPGVNTKVVCIFLPVENSDGFVIGGI